MCKMARALPIMNAYMQKVKFKSQTDWQDGSADEARVTIHDE